MSQTTAVPNEHPPRPQAFYEFDRAPDHARVDVHVVAALYDISVVTVWKPPPGLLPKPIREGGTTRWTVGSLRKAQP